MKLNLPITHILWWFIKIWPCNMTKFSITFDWIRFALSPHLYYSSVLHIFLTREENPHLSLMTKGLLCNRTLGLLQHARCPGLCNKYCVQNQILFMFHTQHISHTPAQYIISDIFRVDICGSALVLISHTRVVLMEIARGLPETQLHIFFINLLYLDWVNWVTGGLLNEQRKANIWQRESE